MKNLKVKSKEPSLNLHKKAKEFFELAKKEIEESKKNGNPNIAVDGSAKAWLAVDLATKALFKKKGVEKIPKTYRGMLYLLQKFGTKELRKNFGYLRDVFHIDGYYEQIIDYIRFKEAFENLEDYIKTIEKL